MRFNLINKILVEVLSLKSNKFKILHNNKVVTYKLNINSTGDLNSVDPTRLDLSERRCSKWWPQTQISRSQTASPPLQKA